MSAGRRHGPTREIRPCANHTIMTTVEVEATTRVEEAPASLWALFKAQNIVIPYPQRDLRVHLDNPSAFRQTEGNNP